MKLRIFTHFIISKGYLFLKEEKKKQAHNFLTYCLQSFAPGRCHDSHSNYEQLKSSFLNLIFIAGGKHENSLKFSLN